ncbi:MAG TPA: beta-galactosidase [Trebonia sp.]|nr:beta-galactosidase [Trebonia sp.]
MSQLEGPTVRGIGYGGDYNPEQWPESTWAEDIRLMAEAGVNLVTVGVFSWSRLQPAPGELTAGWLDRILDRLAEAGIGVDLGTGTATPPPWLTTAHPEILPVTADGRRLAPGSRQHYCPSAPAFRAAAVDLARRMADRYAGHPALVMWHVSNEYGCHVPACYCQQSAQAFRDWLRARYGQLDRLNEAWGGAVWSQDYTSWDQVEPPRATPTFANPAQQLDFARFSNAELLACYLAEREVLTAATPSTPVTTNFMGLFRPVDQFGFAAQTDVASVDSYPDPADPQSYLRSAMTCDLTRSVGGGRPWVLMEQAPNAVNWRPVNVPKAPGQYRALSLQAVGRGGDAVLSFQWRAAATGAEKFHSGMVPHAGTDSRVWREVAGLGADLGRLAPVAGRLVQAEVAMLLDWESWWALEADSHPSRLDLTELLLEFYRPLFEAGVTADFAHPESDLSRYRLLLVPALYLVTAAGADNVRQFVADGGTAAISFFSGIVDPCDRIRLGGYPAPWRELLGLRVEEFAPLPEGAVVRLEGADRVGRLWQDVIDLRGADPVLRYAEGHLTAQAAATRHPYGRGTAFYLGTLPDRATLRDVVQQACASAGLTFRTDVPPGVEAVRRGDYLFMISHLDHPVELDLAGKHLDLLTSDIVGPAVVLGPRGVLVLTARD